MCVSLLTMNPVHDTHTQGNTKGTISKDRHRKPSRECYRLVNCSFASRTYLPKWFPYRDVSNHQFYNPQLSRQDFYTRAGNKTLVESKGKNSLPLIVNIQQYKLSR